MVHVAGNPKLRAAEAKYLQNDGVIDAKEAKELVKIAKETKEDKQVIYDMLASDNFSKDARTAFQKLLGTQKKPAASSLAGTKLGDATITRTIGSNKGYDNKYEAVAAARMAGVSPAAIVYDAKSKAWFPVETTKQVNYMGPLNKDIPFVQSLQPIDDKKVTQLRDKVRGMLETMHADGDVDYKALEQARKELAAATLGVSVGEINLTSKSSDREPGKININTTLGADHKLGTHGSKCSCFDPKAETAIELATSTLEGTYDKKTKTWTDAPKGQAASVLYHEATHMKDHEITREYVNQWIAENPKLRSFDPHGDNTDFQMWMVKKKGIDEATRSLVIHSAQRNHGDTEARAYLGSFGAAIELGQVELARDQLETYAKGIKNKKIDLPTAQVTAQALADLEKLYRSLPKELQKDFDKIIKDITTQYPTWPGSKFDHKTALKNAA